MTAINWVIQYLNNVKSNEFCSIETIKKILEQAKTLEKQQIIDAYEFGDTYYVNAEDYYNDNYKQPK